jgi:two-component system chemotaxis sensor kinase CheA
VQSARQQHEQQTAATSVRVAAEKLDILVNLVGELVTVQARLSQKAAMERDPELLAITEVVERLTAELRDNTLSIRMLPIDVTFSKLRRLVRDLSNELGKTILLKTEGGDTELDKTVIEQLNDPLIHILRNSIDHGIETPDQRRTTGKDEQGIIHLKAEHSGANVLIHISDNGAGIDPEHVRRKAVQRGLLAPDAERTDKELLQLIFAPGFSTADAVTSVSGRGVGMDVVKRSIENLRGAIDIESKKGKGTTITLKLPLTLAIIDGLLVQIDKDKFVLPLAAIEECVELTRKDLAMTHGRNILNIRGQIVPFVPLRERFGIQSKAPEIEQVVINTVDGQRVGIVVDRVIGEHQIVIKTMNALYKNVEEVSGATILGDGTVALILDVQKLLKDLEVESLAA